MKGKLTLAALITAAGIAFSGCGPTPTQKDVLPVISHNVRTKQVEQVFRDHFGYRIYSLDKNGKYIEEKFSLHGGLGSSYEGRSAPYPKIDLPDTLFREIDDQDYEHVKVFRDSTITQAYANIVEYTADLGPNYSRHIDMHYVEIYLPVDQDISPGIERWGGKFPKYEQMKEVK